jgi:ketosteroid isomerase-like protein
MTPLALWSRRVSTGDMNDRDDFLIWVNSRLRDAEIAIHDGNADPRREIWSQQEPVTVLGAWKNAVGQPALKELFDGLEQTFADCTSYEHELLAVDVVSDMAYTVGFEHTQATVNGEQRTYSLRATQVYRCEGGEWKVAHRHADTVAG